MIVNAIYKASQRLVLMTKFDKAKKIGCSGLLFQTVRFRQFQNMNRTIAKLEDLKM
jgi:TRAP-type C4-dicarboxylate transport system substrate-binding protein